MDIKIVLKWLLLVPLIALGLVLLLILPLLVLVKGTVMSYQAEFGYVSSILIGGFAAFVVLFTYLVAVDRVAGKQVFFNQWIKLGISAVVVVSFVMYSLFVLNDENVKNKRIASQYTKAHPVLRLGLRTWSVFDPSIVITDIARNSRFYKRRRMRVYYRSLHFPQKHLDGRVYAFDIRTKGRSKFSNWMTQTIFKMMGYGTLRHVGTADHLHVELVLRKSDKAKILVAERSRRHRVRQARKRQRKRQHKRMLARIKKLEKKPKPVRHIPVETVQPQITIRPANQVQVPSVVRSEPAATTTANKTSDEQGTSN